MGEPLHGAIPLSRPWMLVPVVRQSITTGEHLRLQWMAMTPFVLCHALRTLQCSAAKPSQPLNPWRISSAWSAEAVFEGYSGEQRP